MGAGKAVGASAGAGGESVARAAGAEAARVYCDGREFLVHSWTEADGRSWTMVVERQRGYWISRRTVMSRMAPELAVRGYVLLPKGQDLDPVPILERTLMDRDAVIRRLLNENARLMAERREPAKRCTREGSRARKY